MSRGCVVNLLVSTTSISVFVKATMFSVGDSQSSIRKLESLLRVIKYPGCVNYSGLDKGDPIAFLPILSFSLTSFSPPFAESLVAVGLELAGKTDLRFTDTLYKVLRDVFHYKPMLSKQQFLQSGFSQRKISFTCDIINLVLQRHCQLKKVSRKAFVVDHEENRVRISNSSLKETLSSHNVACVSHTEVNSSFISDETKSQPKREKCKESLLYVSEVEGRLSAPEAQLESRWSQLHKMGCLEKRLEKLHMYKDTEKDDVSVACRLPASSHTFSSISGGKQQDDLKERLERISNMLKNSSSQLQKPVPANKF
nr:centrosomal protein of 44 kDa isoform X1 [Nothobranchius furzeri]